METRRNVAFGLISTIILISGVSSVPVKHQYCPVILDSDLEPGVPLGSKTIRMDEVDGKKLKLQFYYPSANRQRISDSSSAETTTSFQTGPGLGALDDLEGITSTSTQQQNNDGILDTTVTEKSLEFDISCQWDFRASNDSQFLLLTFEKLSAPYSENCEDAFVAMQKDNGYESRWCGNRRQKANARPMSLFSRGSAKISIYRSANAPKSPSTGFTVVVQSVDVNMLEEQNGKNALRVLIG